MRRGRRSISPCPGRLAGFGSSGVGARSTCGGGVCCPLQTTAVLHVVCPASLQVAHVGCDGHRQQRAGWRVWGRPQQLELHAGGLLLAGQAGPAAACNRTWLNCKVSGCCLQIVAFLYELAATNRNEPNADVSDCGLPGQAGQAAAALANLYSIWLLNADCGLSGQAGGAASAAAAAPLRHAQVSLGSLDTLGGGLHADVLQGLCSLGCGLQPLHCQGL